jgi:hypothetical protein
MLTVLQHKSFVELLSDQALLISASMIQIERYLTLIIRPEIRAFLKVEILMFFDQRALNINRRLAYFLSARLRRTSKSQLLKKLSHFRPDNQRQISLDLNHACRYRKRLISSIILQNFYVAELTLQNGADWSGFLPLGTRPKPVWFRSGFPWVRSGPVPGFAGSDPVD